ncbi:T9SS type A sorting domain-containing protein [uncultured Salegentibacter sp.]|uniref:T9SS type A sorting domain-containing protein n=1 Tax=uncultured Salegentibacter sp. TaxID=259320 RepID=UPI0025919E59|nr:T9SS type A sorting domain-containing protein [uncultured Salegentibacter sp.]
MKQKYVLLIVLFSIFYMEDVSSQTVNTTVASEINDVFSQLDKNRIPHDLLLDYGIEFIDITQYDGSLNNDNYMGVSAYQDIYKTIATSATNTSVPGIISPSQMKEEWNDLQEQKNDESKGAKTALLVLNASYFEYSKFRSDALDDNDIQIVSNRYEDVFTGGVWQNPYETNVLFAVSAPVQRIQQSSVIISLPPSMQHTNIAGISGIEVDLDNGQGYQSLNNNANAFANYSTNGVYTWTYRINLGSGNYKYVRQKMEVNADGQGLQTLMASCTEEEEKITASRSYLGQAGSATLQIQYVTGSDCENFQKPLIVAEGFDTGILASEGIIGDSDINFFLQKIEQSNSPQLENLINNNYDIIYVNWDNGTDYIQRNAYVLQKVIDWVNENKTGSEPNVVLGQSMGGLIARYALKDMEDNDVDHETGLYISHDSPHQGAHVPLGFLYMARHMSDQFIESPLGNFEVEVASGNVGLGTIDEILDAPATRQMLVNSVNSNFQIDNSDHDDWQNELENIGYPEDTRNISLSNASHCASPQEVSAGQRLLRLDANAGTGWLTDLVLTFLPLGELPVLSASILLNETAVLAGILPGSNDFNLDFDVNAYPESGVDQIYNGEISYTKRFLWLFPIEITITDRSYDSPSGTLALDTYPGGVNPSFASINTSSFENNVFVSYGYDIAVYPEFNFISATSSLDVGSNQTNLDEDDYTKIYSAADPPIGSKSIPFDNFTTSFNTSSINESHISFNARNGDWLAAELDPNSPFETFDCSFVCGKEIEIIGPDSFCGDETYNLDYSGSASEVTWQVSPSSFFENSSGSGTTAFLEPSTTLSIGEVEISYTIASDCGNVTFSKTLEVATPFVALESFCSDYYSTTCYLSGSGIQSSFNNGEIITLQLTGLGTSGNGFGGDPNWEWERMYGGFEFVSAGSAPGYPQNNGEKSLGSVANLQMNSSGSVQFRARARNECGWGEWKYFIWNISVLGYRYVYYPNPATTNITIENTSFNKSSQTYSTLSKTNAVKGSIVIYDFNGSVVKTEEYDLNSQSFNLDVSKLKPGKYFMKIGAAREEETHQIVIRR